MKKFKFRPRRNIDKPSGFTNAERAERAERLAREGGGILESNVTEDYIAYDLISDLLHLADREGWDPDELLASARANWMDER